MILLASGNYNHLIDLYQCIMFRLVK